MKEFTLIIILLISTLHLSAQDYSDYYSSILESGLSDDPNTGLTVFPLLRMPMGGKYEGMGTALTAMTPDASAMAANPASTSFLSYTELSFSHNNWIADSSLEGILYALRRNNLGLGFGGKFWYVPFTAYNGWGEPTGTGYPMEAIATMNISYTFFSSYYFRGVSLGLNLKAGYRHIPGNLAADQALLALMGDVGVLTKFNLFKFYVSRDKNFGLGATLKNLGFVNRGPDPLPSEAAAGISYSPWRPVTVTFDFNYPFTLSTTPAEEWYLSSGLNVDFTSFFSAQAGFTYRGANPRVSIGGEINLDNVAVVTNYTLDLTTQFDSFDRFSLQAKLKLGDEGRYEKQQRVDELYTAGLQAYAAGNIEKALDYWEALLRIDSAFQPARELMETAARSLELQKRMEDLNQVE